MECSNIGKLAARRQQ